MIKYLMIQLNILVKFLNDQSNNRLNRTRALSRCLLILFSVENTKGQRNSKEFKHRIETTEYLASIVPTC